MSSEWLPEVLIVSEKAPLNGLHVCINFHRAPGFTIGDENFEGGRMDVKYENYRGLKLDRKMVELLKSYQ